VATGKDVFLDRRNQSRIATYAAIRIVCVLDVFADRCLEVANDDGEYTLQDHGQDERECTVDAPDAPVFADDIDWKSLDAKLIYKILSLPAELDQVKNAVSFTFSIVAGPPDYEEGFEERQLRFASLGVVSLKLADALRRKYELEPKAQESAEWSAAVRLREIKASIELKRVERERKQAEKLAEAAQ